MLKIQKLIFLWLILMAFIGCEPNIDTQQITQSAQNLRENVRNIDTQKITQGAQNLRENVRNIDTQKIAQGAQNLKDNLQNFAGSSPVENKSSNPTPEGLKNTDPVLAEILGDVLADDQVQVDQTKQNVEEFDTTRLSDENDFDAVGSRRARAASSRSRSSSARSSAGSSSSAASTSSLASS